jgi:hypothetical protein
MKNVRNWRRLQSGRLEEPLLLDLLKMLDPKLPEGAFRIWWIVSAKRGRSTTEEIRIRAIRIVERVARQRKLTGATFRTDPKSGWLACEFPQHHIQVDLAWYRPAVDNSEKFETVFFGDRELNSQTSIGESPARYR